MHPGASLQQPAIVITGARGFIGSCLSAALFREGKYTLVLSDEFSGVAKQHNLDAVPEAIFVHRDEIIPWITLQKPGAIAWVLHIGARTDTTEFDEHLFDRLNLQPSLDMFRICAQLGIPLIYASSAATYGDGSKGYSDADAVLPTLSPLNPYGWSKHKADRIILQEKQTPPHWYGLKFFNVYGPNEYHKGRMASVVWHAFRQFRETGRVKLFRSHRPEYQDGYQLRDFIYVKDVIAVIRWLMQNTPPSGIYNLGTGKAEPFYTLASAVADAMQIPLEIDWIPIPEDIRATYQYYTEAEMKKLRSVGYDAEFFDLKTGVADYVKKYLLQTEYY